jgi:hypothetical protein
VVVGRLKSTSLNITRSALEIARTSYLVSECCVIFACGFISRVRGGRLAKYGLAGRLVQIGFIWSTFHPECLSILLTTKPNMTKNIRYLTSRSPKHFPQPSYYLASTVQESSSLI